MMKSNLLLAFFLVLLISCTSENPNYNLSEAIRLNQHGYYPNSTKQFILADEIGSTFKIFDVDGNLKYQGNLVENGIWEASGENVFLGDFSELNEEGIYTVVIDEKWQSFEFEIKKQLYAEPLKAAVKSYYFQRASMSIEEAYGGKYQRAAGHIDNECSMHPSTGHDSGTWNGTGGWYDAGDYGKYIGNAALSTGQMLLLAENFSNLLGDGSLNIPESGNGVNDLMDELKYELDWILKMQDEDGGVFFKLTAKSFGGFIMPEEYKLERFVIGKGTASTLNFSAVLAQASRIFKHDEEWSNTALEAAQRAWKWAVENPNVAFKNPIDVQTGEYGDNEFEDDFYWAATELFLTTGEENYLEHIQNSRIEYKHVLHDSWKNFVRNNAFHSALFNAEKLPAEFTSRLKESHLNLANEILNEINTNPYRIGLNDFVWGSNSDILNQAYILCVAHYLTKDDKYLQGTEQITDYIFGKNATAYSYFTGFGDKLVEYPHHRPSGADTIPGAIPGFVVGGSNHDKQDKDLVDYKSDFPAKSFEDVVDSFASNEVCLNWNAPAVFVFGYLETVRN